MAIESLDAPDSLAEGGPFERILRLAPAADPGSPVSVAINDHAAIREQFGIEPPPIDASDEEIGQYKLEMIGMSEAPDERTPRMLNIGDGVMLSGFYRQYLISIGWPGSYLGFGPGDVQQTLITDFTDPPPSGAQEVLVGEFEPEAAQESLAACEDCPEHEIRTYAGQEYFAWGGDLEANLRQRLAPPAFDQFGRGGRIHVGDDHAFRTLTHAQMEGLMDAASGDAPALNDDEDFVLAARAMDTFNATSATISRESFSVEDVLEAGVSEEAHERMRELQLDVLLREYAEESPPVPQPAAVATGLYTDQNGNHGVIAALVFGNEHTAQEAESALAARLAGSLPPTWVAGWPSAPQTMIEALPPTLDHYEDGWGRLLDGVKYGGTGRVVLLSLDPEGRPGAGASGRVVFAPSLMNPERVFSYVLSPLLATEAQEDS